MLAALLNTLSTHFTNILIFSFFGIATLGYYSLVQRVLGIPSVLIGNSIGQVFFQEAIKEKQRTGKFINSFKATLKKLIIIALPFFTILFFIIEDLFVLVFGKDWLIAGLYAKILLPLFMIRFIVSPLTIANQVNLKNKLGMKWQFGLLFLYIFILLISLYINLSFYNTLYLVVTLISFYYIYFLYLIYEHIKRKE